MRLFPDRYLHLNYYFKFKKFEQARRAMKNLAPIRIMKRITTQTRNL